MKILQLEVINLVGKIMELMNPMKKVVAMDIMGIIAMLMKKQQIMVKMMMKMMMRRMMKMKKRPVTRTMKTAEILLLEKKNLRKKNSEIFYLRHKKIIQLCII